MFPVKSVRLPRIIIGFRNLFYNTSAADTKKRRTWITYSLLVFPATAFALGFWQIRRRKWKIELIETLSARIPAKPITLPQNVVSSLELPEFTHVSVRGHFDHSREVIIGPRSLIEDMIPPTGYGSETSILVNRGWVPFGARDPTIRPNGQVKGIVELSGYVRYPEKPPIRIFGTKIKNLICLDENQNPHIRYSCRNIEKMCDDLKTLPIFVDADYESSIVGGPVGGQTRVALRNEHASYIFTWFSLGITGLGMWIYFFIM
ncbi:unnamed protein product [Heterobilharzia americana]|nr:unnamed protein product [Heterobilharzia americana]